MMYEEFVNISGLNVSYEDYTNIVEPMYMSTVMSKQEFIKFISPSVKALVKSYPKEKTIRKMLVRDKSGFKTTPNNCWYHIEYVELINIDIKTGKYIVAPLDDADYEELSRQGKDLDKSSTYDFDYTECLDSKTKEAIKLWYE